MQDSFKLYYCILLYFVFSCTLFNVLYYVMPLGWHNQRKKTQFKTVLLYYLYFVFYCILTTLIIKNLSQTQFKEFRCYAFTFIIVGKSNIMNFVYNY